MQQAINDKALVHIVDDDASMRAALEGLFDSVGLQTKTYAMAKDFFSVNLSDRPGCIVLDVRLPDMNGLEFQTRLIQSGVGVPVVMMTGHGDIPMSVHAMKQGAVDFLAKPFRDQDILDALNHALNHDRKRRDGDKAVSRLRQLFESLTRREREILTLVISGLMNKQIGHQLHVTEITVKIHRGHVMRKMEARSFADLVRMAETLGIKRSD